jgi:hypothetical protein
VIDVGLWIMLAGVGIAALAGMSLGLLGLSSYLRQRSRKHDRCPR